MQGVLRALDFRMREVIFLENRRDESRGGGICRGERPSRLLFLGKCIRGYGADFFPGARSSGFSLLKRR